MLAAGPAPAPGVGGWPTIRYFNSATPTAGAGYNMVKNPAGNTVFKEVCDELKCAGRMEGWIRGVLASTGTKSGRWTF